MCVKSLLFLLNLDPEMECYLSLASSAVAATDSSLVLVVDSTSPLSLRPAACYTDPDSALLVTAIASSF